MKPLYLFIPVILITGCSRSFICSEPTLDLVSVSIIDRNGMTETIGNPERLKQYNDVDFLTSQPYQKVLRIYSRDSFGNISAYITSYHPNGQPKQYLEIVNSRACGKYQEWHENGTLKLEATIVGGEADLNKESMETWLFHGPAIAWNENGGVIADIRYQNGYLEGPSNYYHDNGSIWKQVNYHLGKSEGPFETYTNNGQLLQVYQYKSGQKEGPAERRWGNNNLAAEETYKNDLIVSGSYYDLSGKLIAEIKEGCGFRAVFGKESITELHEYKDGIPEGQVKIFGTDGKLNKLYHIKNELNHGEEIEYFSETKLRDKPCISINWHEGKIQGLTRSWYDNGVLESQREMSNNKKNGIATAWYRDGSLMLIEEYEQDKLIRGQYFKRKETTPISTIKNSEGIATIFDSEGNFVRKITYRSGVPLG